MPVKRRATAVAAAAIVSIGLIGAPPAHAATGDPVLINEALMSTTGSDVEYLELYGTPGASLAGLSILVVEGNAGTSQGEIDRRLDLPSDAVLGDNGYYLLGNASVAAQYGVTPDLGLAGDFFENSSSTVALVETTSLGGKDVGDSVVGDAAIVVRDGFASVDATASTTYFGVPVLGPDGGFFPAGWGRTTAGVDTDTAGDWTLLNFTLGSPNDPTAGTFAAPASPLVINAALVSTVGSDPEYIELFGEPGTSLDGLAVVGIESDAGASNGIIDHYYPFPSYAKIGENGFYLLGNDLVGGTFGILPNQSIPQNGLENSSLTLGIVSVADLGGADAGDALPSGVAALDAVGITDGGASDSFFLGAPVVGPDGSFLPAGVRRVSDGVDTDTVADWDILVFNPADAEINTPTAGTGDTGAPAEVSIHEVQGAGASSPLVGEAVTVEAVVVGDHEGSSPTLRGFFLQEEDADADGDPATSEGVFVFNGSSDSVSLGDQVKVTGVVSEYFGMTQISASEIEVLDSGVELPTPATIEFPLSSVDALEAYEGMIGTLPQELVVSEYFNYDRFGDVVVALPSLEGTDRVMNPTAVYAPDSPEAAELRDVNLRSRITIDDGSTASNPDVNVHPINREPFSLDNSFRGGDSVTGLTGPIFFSFDLYRILPYGDGAGYTEYSQTEAPAEPEAVGGDLRVASLNALNYFVSLDTADTCGPTQDQDCRGADDREEFERQHAKLMNALVGLDADVVGLVEIENTPGVEALATIVDGEDGPDGDGSGLAGLNDVLGEGTYGYIAAGTDSVVGTDAIKTGVIYRTGAVTPYGASAVLDTPEFLNPLGADTDKNRAAVAQSFVENASGEVFSVAVNHLKSKGSECDEPGEGGLTGSCNDTRTAAAGVLADWIAGDPTGSGDADWLILGDLNSYDKEEPIVALQDAGFADLIGDYQGEYAYSYVFDGEVGYLDYVMSSQTLTGQVTGATEWHINADEPDILDYDTSFRSSTQQTFFDASTPFRASDHDAALIGLDLDGGLGSFAIEADPGEIFPPNHRMRDITLTVDPDDLAVTAISAVSSEADCCLDENDVPNDIAISDGEIAVRAERYAKEGRTYTITAAVTDGTQVVLDDVEVVVSHDRGRGRGRAL
ncbi:ExeM/NucH family extracellular endonuclease [Microbacter sp. GSS18]|nr:ExeM/NucH family extracellular endonuclease [Microbacter sp. GSS18]